MARYRFCLLTLPFVTLFSVACADDAKLGETKSQQQWTSIVKGDWTLAAGSEIPELCVEAVLKEDIYVSAIRPVHPLGTHHTLLAIGDTKDGRCNANVATGLIYAAGVGSDEGIHLPPGVAMKLAAGRVLKLGLHLYNTRTEEIRGTSGMEVKRIKPEEVQFLSEAALAGPFDLAIPPGRSSVSNSCGITEEQTLYALFPHMHQLGVHFKTTATVAGNPIVLHDGAYDFEEQYQLALSPLTLRVGDTITTECTYQNPTAKTVTFGESSDTEMCFSIMFRYPPTGRSFCAGGGGLAGPPCAADGAPGNDVGVGKQCSKDGGQCEGAGLATTCLADYASGEFANFCTKTCAADADCGAGAMCSPGSGSQRFCLPNTCLRTPDGG